MSMMRNLVGAIVYWIPTILTGLLLACCTRPSDTENQISSTALSSPTNSAVYYVAVNKPGASDDNNGLYPTYQDGQDGPWVTIQRAASTGLPYLGVAPDMGAFEFAAHQVYLPLVLRA